MIRLDLGIFFLSPWFFGVRGLEERTDQSCILSLNRFVFPRLVENGDPGQSRAAIFCGENEIDLLQVVPPLLSGLWWGWSCGL